MYEYSCHKDLRHRYDFVVRLSLRKLEHTGDLKQLLFDELFKLDPRGHELAAKLSHLILKQGHDEEVQSTKSPNILFILGGLDETRGWSQEKLDLLENGQFLTEEIINAVRDSRRLERPVRAEIDVLSKISIKLTDQSKVEFVDGDIINAINELEQETKTSLPLGLDKNIQKLSFLRMDSSHVPPTCAFLHLTFQEFFAAEYLVNEKLFRIRLHRAQKRIGMPTWACIVEPAQGWTRRLFRL
ncbi:hypothetical protein QQX98_006870 [Neonectria punicea]|uniref:Uncharacterized protein n=1 Tax=Neonectria punicea TaxID=979145 RepID=A0ABR1H001_9HYPO